MYRLKSLLVVLMIALAGLGVVGTVSAPPAHAACSIAAYNPYTQPGYSGTLRGQLKVSGCGTVYIQVCVQRYADGATLGCRTQYTNSTLWWYESYNASSCFGKTWAWVNGYGVYTSGYSYCT